VSERENRSALEQEIAAALRRTAPRPGPDLLSRALTAIDDTSQTDAGREPVAARRSWVLALGGTAAVGILIGLFMGSRLGTSPSPGNGSPSPRGSNSAGPTPASIDWQEPAAYSFTYDWCGGESNLTGKWHIRVENGAVVGFERLDGGPPPIAEPHIPTLAQMLAHARAAQAGENPHLLFPQLPSSPGATEAPIVSLMSDPGDGHPLEIRIDWLPAAIDDEECYRISNYRLTQLASATPPLTGWEKFDLSQGASGRDVSIAGGFAGESRVVVVGGGAEADPSAGQVPLAWYSDDGRIWHASEIDSDGTSGIINAMDIVFAAEGRLYAFAGAQDATAGAISLLFESTDEGATWTRFSDGTEPTGGYVRDVVAGGPGFVAVGVAARGLGVGAGSMVWTSSDGRNWRPIAQGDGTGIIAKGSLDAVAVHAGTLMAVGSNLASQGQPQSVWVSSDGRTWTEIDTPADMHVTDITWAHGAWLATGTGHSATASQGDVPTMWRSTDDGRSWMRIHLDSPGGVRSAWRVAAADDGRLVAVGDAMDHAVAWTSIDGTRWEATILPFGSPSQPVAWAVVPYKEHFVVAGNGQNESNESEPMVWLGP
jgi:photosystem II stability/assembly factor-like uncharacterized protein